MARKRLSPPQETYLAAAPETKALAGPFGPLPHHPAPIAQVAGDSALSAALREVTDELHAARAEGRLVQRLPLGSIEADHLVRDRIAENEDEMQALLGSIRARGQQTPIEVVDLGAGRYGLISGWRRLRALAALHEETGESRFATVQALLRRPEGASDAYLAMVEENEIRVGLGHYERARIAARAVEMGVYPDLSAALRHLFQSASRAKRSKIGSFVTLYQALDSHLRFPAALPERLGLALVQAIEADKALIRRIRSLLASATPRSPAEEQALLTRALKPAAPLPVSAAEEVLPGLFLHLSGPPRTPRLTLSGPALDPALRARLTDWLKSQG